MKYNKVSAKFQPARQVPSWNVKNGKNKEIKGFSLTINPLLFEELL